MTRDDKNVPTILGEVRALVTATFDEAGRDLHSHKQEPDWLAMMSRSLTRGVVDAKSRNWEDYRAELLFIASMSIASINQLDRRVEYATTHF